MNEMIFETSQKTKWLCYSSIIIIVGVGLIALALDASWWTFSLYLLPCYLGLSTFVFQKYTITDTSLNIKNALGGRTRCIPLSSIAKLTRKKRGFIVNCKFADGKVGIYEIRYVFVWEQMLDEIVEKTGVRAVCMNSI